MFVYVHNRTCFPAGPFFLSIDLKMLQCRGTGGAMIIFLNGEPRDIDPNVTLGGVLQSIGFDSETVILELNGEILPRDRVQKTELNESDAVEVISFVGGG